MTSRPLRSEMEPFAQCRLIWKPSFHGRQLDDRIDEAAAVAELYGIDAVSDPTSLLAFATIDGNNVFESSRMRDLSNGVGCDPVVACMNRCHQQRLDTSIAGTEIATMPTVMNGNVRA